jgi:hypothetical protein
LSVDREEKETREQRRGTGQCATVWRKRASGTVCDRTRLAGGRKVEVCAAERGDGNARSKETRQAGGSQRAGKGEQQGQGKQRQREAERQRGREGYSSGC